MIDAVYTPYIQRKTSNALTQVTAGSPGVHSIIIANADAATRYVQVFDAVSADVTVGTTTPTMVYPCPATDGREYKIQTKFSNGFTYAVTTTPTGNTGPTEVWVQVNM